MHYNYPMELKCESLSAGYDNKKVLNNISFSLFSGDFVALCGPNGSGKSTLLSVLASLAEKSLKSQEGTVLISKDASEPHNLIPLSSLSQKEKAKKIAYMQQTENSTWDFTVFDFVLQGRFAYSKNGWYSDEDEKIAQDSLNELGLSNFSNRTIHSLSGGEFQKVRIARALTQQPAFMLLDEPAANIDFVYEPKLLELLRSLAEKKNIGVILSIHDVNLASLYSKKMALLSPNNGFIFGPTEQIFTEENLSKAFGTNLHTYTPQSYTKLQVTHEQ